MVHQLMACMNLQLSQTMLPKRDRPQKIPKHNSTTTEPRKPLLLQLLDHMAALIRNVFRGDKTLIAVNSSLSGKNLKHKTKLSGLLPEFT